MIIFVDLKNKNLCADCPCVIKDSDYPWMCALGHWEQSWRHNVKDWSKEIIIRPLECIKEHGL